LEQSDLLSSGREPLSSPIWIEIIQMNIISLAHYCLETPISKPSGIFARLMLHYLQNEMAAFKSLQARLDVADALYPVVELRRRSRDGEPLDADLLAGVEIASKKSDWIRGEVQFLLGGYHSVKKDHATAKAHFLSAAAILRDVGAYRKSLKAKFNIIVEESNERDAEQNFAPFYMALAKECRKAKEFGVAGLAYSNAARELQICGAFHEALRFSQKALIFLRADQGAYHYHLAILQKADLLFDLGRKSEAFVAMEETRGALFPEVIEARKILLRKSGLSLDSNIDECRLLETWRERLEMPEVMPLGQLEQSLISLLAERPRSRQELIEVLYRDQGKASSQSLTNRFNVLLNRVRKRNHHMIVFQNNRYELLPPVHQSLLSREVCQKLS